VIENDCPFTVPNDCCGTNALGGFDGTTGCRVLFCHPWLNWFWYP
jgi:hypothetical protein